MSSVDVSRAVYLDFLHRREAPFHQRVGKWQHMENVDEAGDVLVLLSVVDVQHSPDVTWLLLLQVDCDEVFQVSQKVFCITFWQNGGEVVCCHLHTFISVHCQLVTVVWPQVGVKDGCTVEDDSCIVHAESFLTALAYLNNFPGRFW